MNKLKNWLCGLLTEKEADGSVTASMGRHMGWMMFMADLAVMVYAVLSPKRIPNLEPVLGFMEMLTLFVLGYVFAGKTVLNKGKYGLFGEDVRIAPVKKTKGGGV